MSDWPIGLSTGCFLHSSILDVLPRIRGAGFGIIEVCSFPAHLDYHDRATVERAASEIDRLGLEAYSFHAPLAPHIDITSFDAEARQRATDEILRAAEAAGALGVRYFVIHPGPESGGFADQERWTRLENAAGVLERVAARCRELDVSLVLENMLPHLCFGRVRDLMWILGSLHTTDVGICLDTGHAYLSGDLRTVAHKLAGHLWVVHASDNHGHGDDHLPPGAGRIDWTALLAQLAGVHFRGGLILEIAGASSVEETLARASRGRRHLLRVARALHKERHRP